MGIKKHQYLPGSKLRYPEEKRWLDNGGRFLFGKYKGELVSIVVEVAPGYLRWAIKNDDMDLDDFIIIETHLKRAGELNDN